MTDSSLNSAIREFEAVEANLVKLEKILDEINKAIPDGTHFVIENPEYEDNCRSFHEILTVLPKIDGWKPDIVFMDLDEITKNRLTAQDIGKLNLIVDIEKEISKPSCLLRKYRFHFNQKRKKLIRNSLVEKIESVDDCLRDLLKDLEPDFESSARVDNPLFEDLKDHIKQIDTLLGSSVPRPTRWSDLYRHLQFGLLGDLDDIIRNDWPNIKKGLRKSLYDEKEPVPNDIEDLSSLINNKPKGTVTAKLEWDRLQDDDFERLIFSLISSEKEYENPEWLTNINAPDRGRDLSVYRVYVDSLAGTIRQRVIIQCKHWLSKSVSLSDISNLKDQMKLWEPPRVDIHIIATSGRFTSDAVSFVEKNNQSDTALKIETWSESNLERLLAERPNLIAEFSLR